MCHLNTLKKYTDHSQKPDHTTTNQCILNVDKHLLELSVLNLLLQGMRKD